MTPSTSKSTLKPLVPALLLGVALGESALAAYQWLELLKVAEGAKVLCSISKEVDCATVWMSPLAKQLHRFTGVPVAGLGVVWGVLAAAMSGLLLHRVLGSRPFEVSVAAVRWVAVGGVAACITFITGSFLLGTVCPTCLGTYVLVLGFTALVFFLPGRFPPQGAALKQSLLTVVAVGVVTHLVFLYPGQKTPGSVAEADRFPKVAGESREAIERQVTEFLLGLPWAERQAVLDVHRRWQVGKVPDTAGFAARRRWGSESAPVRIVDFTDIRCGHCGALEHALQEIKRVVPADNFSVEARHFPLDGECNPHISRRDGSGISCTGAKAQICLEGAPDYWELRERLFEAQHGLTTERILEIASSGSVKKDALVACLSAPETQRRLAEDIDYAVRFDIQGTPLVVVNGRDAEHAPPGWLYAITMLRGNGSSPAFTRLAGSLEGQPTR